MARHPYPWQNVFCESLRTWPVVQTACDIVGIERSTAYRARHADEDFAKAWEEAMEAGVDRAEQEAMRRAVQGVEKAVWHQGVPVGTETVYSDALLGKVLAARRKAYRTQSTELTSPDGSMSPAADEGTRAARVAQLLALAEQRQREEAQRRADAEDFG